MTAAEIQEYLEGFNYRLGEREKEAMEKFRGLVGEIDDAKRSDQEAAPGRDDATF